MKKLLPLLFVCLLLCGCSRQAQATLYHMNTVMTLDIHMEEGGLGLAGTAAQQQANKK